MTRVDGSRRLDSVFYTKRARARLKPHRHPSEDPMSNNTATAEEFRAGLRAWAKGVYHTEAAVELLIRGGWAHPDHPWIEECDPDWHGDNSPRMWFVDWDKLDYEMGPFSGGEQRFLTIAVQLAKSQIDPSGLDRDKVDLILAAIAHAAGTHEGRRVEVVTGPDGKANLVTGPAYTSLHPWPANQ